ncbi:peptidylprolyl isomerase [Ornithinimicrobium sp. LYQ103]|uniref:peptidylprolyl isomerase n=1 Tax=Ornithinimicrobium sp. LYQ103 TaxID=3378796 RepID=UPI0038526792
MTTVATLALTGCGDGGTTPPGSTAAPDCEDPPALRSEVPTYTPQDLPAPHPGDAARVSAVVETNCGDLVVELDAAAAPQTVTSFLFLAGEGYWDDSPCHRLTTSGIYVLQCGDPTGTGRGNPGYGYGIENAPADGAYPRGTVAMARTQDPNSNGGQFFIVHQDSELPTEGGGYSIVGRVTEGMDVVDLVASAGAQGGAADGPPAQPVSILSVDVGDR